MDENNLFEKDNEKMADTVENTENTENTEIAEDTEPVLEDGEKNVAILGDEPTEDSSEEPADEDFSQDTDENGEGEESADGTDDESETAADDEIVDTENVAKSVAIIEETPKKSKKGLILAIVLIIIVVALGAYIAYNSLGNKYNKMGYLDVEGETIEDICQQMNMTLEDFKEQYQLPEDMPADTYSNAASNLIPIKVFVEMYNTDFATFKESFHLPDTTSPSKPTNILGKIKSIFVQDKPVEITEDTPIGVAQDEVELKYLVGEENIDKLKELYGFGDEVTGETKYKEVRPAMEKYSIKERLQQEKEAAQKDSEENTEDQNTENTDNADNATDTADNADTAQEGTDAQSTDTAATDSTAESDDSNSAE